jgi:hypothetical protein
MRKRNTVEIEGVTIRRSRASDHAALLCLAQLDSQPLAAGELLVAEVCGELRAAVPLVGGPAIADPFQPTASLVSLLSVRVEQLRRPEAAEPHWLWIRLAARSVAAGR